MINRTSQSEWGVTKDDLIIESTLLTILALFILFGNGLVCIAFKKERKLQTTTNYFVVSLACSDLMVGALIIPLYLYIKNAQVPLDSLLYRVWLSLEIVTCGASITSLAAVSVERCLSVKVPAIHRNLSRKVVYGLIALVWIHSMVTSGASFNLFFSGGELRRWLPVYWTVASFILPLTVTVVAYGFIFNVALSRSRRHNNSLSREIRIALTIAVVIGAFVCAWTPFFVFSLLAAYAKKLDINWRVALVVTKWLHYLNSVVNPIIYTFGNQDFRKTFLKLLRCLKKQRPRLDSRLSARTRTDSRLESKTENTTLKSSFV